MTTPPTNQNLETPPDTTPVVAPVAKPGIPRAALLGGAVVLVGGIAGLAFFLLPKLTGSQPAADSSDTTAAPPPAVTKPVGAPIGGNRAAKPNATANAAKSEAAKAAKAAKAAALASDVPAAPTNVSIATSFDNVPKDLGGTEAPYYAPGASKGKAATGATATPPTGGTAAAAKPAPIVQGQYPGSLRPDPFVSRLIIPQLRAYAYTLAIPIRLAPQPKPPTVKLNTIDPELALGPLPYIPRRVAGFLQDGGVSAILETGGFGNGAIDIVSPGQTVASGIPGIPPLTVESISSTEMVLRAEDGRTTKVALSNVPGGIGSAANLGAGVGGANPGFPGGRPGGFPGGQGGARAD